MSEEKKSDLDKIQQDLSGAMDEMVREMKQIIQERFYGSPDALVENEEYDDDEPLIIAFRPTTDAGVQFIQLNFLRESAREKAWQSLLDLYLPEADSVTFHSVCCSFMNIAETPIDWQWSPPPSLLPFLVEPQPANALDDDTMSDKLYRFTLADPVVDYLHTGSDLLSWHVVSRRPEDPALYKGDQKILWTISHEDFIWVRLTESILDRANETGLSYEFIDADQVDAE